MAAAGDKDPAPYQSLYRRFRPQRFEEVLGQEHVSLALRNAVRDGRVGHAYLFSGPRGTGKTSTARILAKALNCAALEDGEPCGRCDSCVEIARGASLDVHELDAASNNGVDAMRDLVSHAALGTPGRWKVYIVDEVHMLSTAASNALLKTLEEPPGHVVFVLATTDAQKVLPTIRSRTQHFEFRLLGSETLSALLHQVRTATGLALPDEALDAAVRRGRGSARDALSALDQVAAGGIVDDDIEVLAELAEALAERDPARALVAVAHASEAGRDPQRLAADLAEYLRQGFLAIVAGELVSLSGADRSRVEDTARRMGLPALVRALEELGRAQVDMRDIPDQRVHLEVALIKLTHPQADDSTVALLERVERLERALAEGGAGAGPPTETMPARTLEAPPAAPGGPSPTRAGDARRRERQPTPTPEDAGVAHGSSPPTHGRSRAGPAPSGGESGPDLARRTLGAVRRQSGSSRGTPRTDAPGTDRSGASRGGTDVAARNRARVVGLRVVTPGESTGAVATLPSRDELVQVWGDGLLAQLPEPGPGPVPGGKVPRRRRGRRRSSRCPTRPTVRIAKRSVSMWRRRWRRASGRRCPSGSWSTRCRRSTGRRAAGSAAPTPRPHRRRRRPPRRRRDRAGARAGPRTGHSPVPVIETTAAVATGRHRGGATAVSPTDDDAPDLLDPAVLAAETELAGAGLSPEERSEAGLPRRARGIERVRRPVAGPGGRARAPPGHRAQVRPAHRLPPPEGGPRGRHAPGRADRGGERTHHPVSPVLQRRRGRPLCAICSDDRRDGTVLCVVEDPRDIVAVEKTQEFRGRYHVLHGALNPIEGVGPDQIRVKELLGRLDDEADHRDHPVHQPQPRR